MSYEQKLDDETHRQLAELASIDPQEAAQLSVAYEQARGRERDGIAMMIEAVYNETLSALWREARERSKQK